jgi:hypothetical protein
LRHDSPSDRITFDPNLLHFKAAVKAALSIDLGRIGVRKRHFGADRVDMYQLTQIVRSIQPKVSLHQKVYSSGG